MTTETGAALKAEHKAVETSDGWTALTQLGRHEALSMLERMVVIRHFEQTAYFVA